MQKTAGKSLASGSLMPTFSRYFLYAANNIDSFAELLRIRRVMFDIARTRTVDSEVAQGS
ncbi:MAG: hypothetical protein U5R30_09355 [Deltaproteobacteria bacterium]|nr:hypothetical protein [Deltaproteobacteria bacterium]